MTCGMTCGMTFMARDTGCQIRDARYVTRDVWHEIYGTRYVVRPAYRPVKSKASPHMRFEGPQVRAFFLSPSNCHNAAASDDTSFDGLFLSWMLSTNSRNSQQLNHAEDSRARKQRRDENPNHCLAHGLPSSRWRSPARLAINPSKALRTYVRGVIDLGSTLRAICGVRIEARAIRSVVFILIEVACVFSKGVSAVRPTFFTAVRVVPFVVG